MGLHQKCWSYHTKFVTLMQSTVRDRHPAMIHVIGAILSHPVPLQNHLAILT